MQIDFTPDPELYPFASQWRDVSAGRMHYVDEGEGRPIVLLHGNPTWSFLYRNVIPGLRDRFRCIAIDLLGFGLSDRPEGFGYTAAEHAVAVGELVDALELEDLIVMGHDWGGPIGLSMAAERAERVHGVVLGNTWFWPADLTMRAFSLFMSSPPLQWAILRRNAFVEQIMPAASGRKLTKREMDHYRGTQPNRQARAGVAEFPRQIAAAGDWFAALEPRVRDRLGAKRTLITWPMRDFSFPAGRFLPRVRDAFPDAKVVELERARHYFQEDQPDDVARAIAGHFG